MHIDSLLMRAQNINRSLLFLLHSLLVTNVNVQFFSKQEHFYTIWILLIMSHKENGLFRFLQTSRAWLPTPKKIWCGVHWFKYRRRIVIETKIDLKNLSCYEQCHTIVLCQHFMMNGCFGAVVNRLCNNNAADIFLKCMYRESLSNGSWVAQKCMDEPTIKSNELQSK